MSLHKSLKGSTKIQVKRNVRKRYERVDYLMEQGRWKPAEDKPIGLPKTPPTE